MTDIDMLFRVMSALDPDVAEMRGLFRRGRLLVAFPAEAEAAGMALRLYQPQRWMARAAGRFARFAVKFGPVGRVLRKPDAPPDMGQISPALPRVDPGTCGVLLGSPEHRIRRAVASFRSGGEWQVAKIAFGDEGRGVIDGEAAAMESLPEGTRGIPGLHEIHRGAGISLLRMPYLKGRVLRRGEYEDALGLLDSWRSDLAPRAITEFSEWSIIEGEILKSEEGRRAMEKLQGVRLSASVRHGDFARWNLIRDTNGNLTALDWEWGTAHGMPGMDAAHFFLQDAMLVDRKEPAEAVRAAIRFLERDSCMACLGKAGWPEDPLLPVIANLAYKQGSNQQNTRKFLDAALRMLR